jgi:hypothetical protein
MLNHLAILIIVNSFYVSLHRISKPSSHVAYDMKLVEQRLLDVLITAVVLGVSFGAFSVLVVYIIQWNQNILVVIASIFISVGMARQISATALDVVTTNMNAFLSSWTSIVHLLAKDRQTSEWPLIRERLEAILLGKELNYDLPIELHGVKPNSPQLFRYLNENKWELEYQHVITSEDQSSLAFAQHAIMHMRDKLGIYDQLIGVQERSGGVNTVVLIAIGTLIWLIS